VLKLFLVLLLVGLIIGYLMTSKGRRR